MRLTVRNFSLWELHIRLYVQGLRLSGVLDGYMPHTDDTATDKEKADWEASNAHVRLWIFPSVDSDITLSLWGFYTAHDMWQHLQCIHSQTNATRKFELETTDNTKISVIYPPS
ncbi:unnamed protein product [Linum trigynum]|uniref:Uncharacterized protein n=1 Tax=Linum trigynum TaxID=586398 RepID=A0AAV2E8J0_9ROSI